MTNIKALLVKSLRSSNINFALRNIHSTSIHGKNGTEKKKGWCFVLYNGKRTNTRYWAETTNKKDHDSKINEWRDQFKILQAYNDTDLMIWRDSFNKMDKDKDNYISQADLQKSDWSLEKYTLFQNYDIDKNNLIDFGEYIQAVIDIDTQHFKNFFQGFSKIDMELEFQKYAITGKENNKKVIPLERLKQMLKDKEFTCITDTDSRNLFNFMDVNKDGEIDFEDFRSWLGKE